jgi:mRNA interferase RelE/StbE
MTIKIDRALERDVAKIKDKAILKRLYLKILEIQKASKLSEIKNLKKLKGTKNFYRVKIGDYRIGMLYQNRTMEIIRFLHRKDIYRYFP